ncbi:DUF4010 domain-containing protein [Sphingomonas sp. RG327]|uniref:DUF4010 domain-containing protein n=1 Tax=Sphingomonas anseongensis TaxID=2908207 RepID=A0ABT0RG97_9SPHN|nr:DUF4010 domain-containing protein [Sphingomonas anseongensis]
MKSGTRIAGVRTFTLVGLASGIAGLIAALGQGFAGAAIVTGAAAILSVGYAHRPDLSERPDATTPIAAMATIGLGFLAGSGNPALAIAGATIVTLILSAKRETHGILNRLDEEDVKALAQYAVVAGAVLPFLPNGRYGPLGAWNPQQLWLVVIIVTGFSFLGYVANRLFGERHGTIATAVIGGLYSSTAVTQSLSERLGRAKTPGAEPAGIALATAVMYVRVLLLVAILATRIAIPFAIITFPAILVGAGAGWWLYRESPRSDSPTAPGNPVALLPALGFVAFVAIMAVAVTWAEGRFGQQGIALLLLISGSANVDVAIVTAGSLPPQSISANLAAIALAGTIVANMWVKIGVTLVYAKAKGRSAAISLIASTLVLVASIAVAWFTMV